MDDRHRLVSQYPLPDMLSNICNSESPDIHDEDMDDPASSNFEAISENTQLALYNPDSPEIEMENLSP